jgi:oligosaccharide repeat unit polymerase
MASGEALVLSIALIGLAALMRTLTGTWLQPGSFFFLFWCFAGILPMILAPHEPVGANAVWWLIAAGIAVSIGGYVGNGGFKTVILAQPGQATNLELNIFAIVMSLSIVLGVGSSIAFLKASSIPLSDVFNLEKLVVVSNRAYFQTYAESGAPPPPPISQALLPFVYLAPALGGIFFEMTRRKVGKLIALASFFPAVAVTILQTTKAAVLFAMVLWLSGYFATRLRFGKLAVFTRGHLLTAAVAGIALTVFFFAVSLARLASTDVSLLNVVLLKLISGAFGHMTVFSQWLAEYWNQPFEPTLGSVTFAGPLEMLGFSQRIPGLFASLIELVVGETSNIYTAFRPLIQDFGIPGALAILTLLGAVGGIGFRMIASGRWSGLPLLLVAYVTIFWTPITWFWIYNSLTATVVAVGFTVFFIRFWRGARPAHLQGDQFVGTK